MRSSLTQRVEQTGGPPGPLGHRRGIVVAKSERQDLNLRPSAPGTDVLEWAQNRQPRACVKFDLWVLPLYTGALTFPASFQNEGVGHDGERWAWVADGVIAGLPECGLPAAAGPGSAARGRRSGRKAALRQSLPPLYHKVGPHPQNEAVRNRGQVLVSGNGPRRCLQLTLVINDWSFAVGWEAIV